VTDNDDLLTLPVDDDGIRDEAGASADRGAEAAGASGAAGGRSAGRNPMSVHGSELVSLSSEARLATALLLQAQALEGMRQAHSDLLSRLDAGGGGGARRSEELQSALKEVQQAQQQALGQLTRARHRASQRTAMFGALLVCGALAAAWLVQSSRSDMSRALDDTRTELAASAAADRTELEASLAAAMAASGSRQVAMLEELISGMRGSEAQLRDLLDKAIVERDEARQLLAGKALVATDLEARLAAAQQGNDALEQELERTSDERNRQIGEASRLREQVADRDRRLGELVDTISKVRTDLEARAAAPDGRIVSTDMHPGAFAVQLTAALHGSGAKHASVLEAGPVSDGALTGLLVMLGGAEGAPGQVMSAEHGRLLVESGRALLRLETLQASGSNTPASHQDIELPALDAAAWRALGLNVPAGFVPIPRVAAALDALLVSNGYRVIQLQSFDGLTLGGLELRQEDSRGQWLRTLKAARGEVLPIGPELALEEGSILIGSDDRPFFQGQCRVPLPGADYGAWLASTASDSP